MNLTSTASERKVQAGAAGESAFNHSGAAVFGTGPQAMRGKAMGTEFSLGRKFRSRKSGRDRVRLLKSRD